MKEFLNPDFVNTSESFSKNIFIANNIILIPYVGISIVSNNPLVGKSGFLNFSYYIFENVTSLVLESESVLISADYSLQAKGVSKENVIVGGYDKEYKGAELEITYKASLLVLPDDCQFSTTPFIPTDYPFSKGNMNSDSIKKFFNEASVSRNFRDKLGVNYWTFTV